ncbi:NhaC-type sodium/hydrogen antiporter [Thermococcus onnurineus NA1]|uniref:NhaC-type sodium/hydrogen antiporter n=1 Tax=Thermococcus onnurineus (strain NA1) TaxID=523850 RepID=B6YTR6_THEON|nr:Na+/H+ antiporter NhaC family protein [Thermococcus onnurineus]ACJ17007.1 NhaC-type sodium/hydrogen antiporter [Thermococcus onnurineus NA1]NJE46655.1 Na+/H+ antiporter NhaC family protein [Thermococcus sp. GR7]NJE77917.1 Na+/H+ antiporter NhaC family protein [Thermococcus sp. GR4]NJF23045.1 Na+/H+ antiporter NhaC family protein [Thermococcus sp. GR5]
MSDFGVLALLPPLVAIILAIWTKRVILALFAGVWIGGVMVAGGNPVVGTTQTLEWIVSSVTSDWNARILIFNFLIGAGVGLIYKSGAVHALAASLVRRVKSSRGASILGWILGILVFFDDYTNTIVVGNTMRPITDRMRVSREMLAYIDDSTAAPVAGLALVSTWIGYELLMIGKGFDNANIVYGTYDAWLSSVPYRFYSILAIILVFIVAYTHRHYGPMLKAEYRARTEGKVLRDGAKPLMTTEVDLGTPNEGGSLWDFVIPLLVLVGVSMLGLWYTGAANLEAYSQDLGWWTELENPFGVNFLNYSFIESFREADAATALLWGSFAMVVVASIMLLGRRKMTVEEWEDTVVRGMKQMLFANTILVLAWSLGTAAESVGTGDYVISLATSSGANLGPWMPLIMFLSAMFVAFTTGTSWGTFAIMVPLGVQLSLAFTNGQVNEIVFATIGATFTGSIFGDHCSPISDTTIMSSMFSGSDHIDHVTTQIPYAFTVATIGSVLYLLFALGVTSWVILLPLGIALLVGAWYVLSEWYGKKYGIPHGKVPIYVAEE